jgi:hypothetical protein
MSSAQAQASMSFSPLTREESQAVFVNALRTAEAFRHAHMSQVEIQIEERESRALTRAQAQALAQANAIMN